MSAPCVRCKFCGGCCTHSCTSLSWPFPMVSTPMQNPDGSYVCELYRPHNIGPWSFPENEGHAPTPETEP